jgi:hypothetical protein
MLAIQRVSCVHHAAGGIHPRRSIRTRPDREPPTREGGGAPVWGFIRPPCCLDLDGSAARRRHLIASLRNLVLPCPGSA